MTEDIAGLIKRAESSIKAYEITHNDDSQACRLLRYLADSLRALAQEIERLHERLEDNHEFELKDGRMVRIEVTPGSIPDGIECRDETIKLQDERILKLEAAQKFVIAAHDGQVEDKNFIAGQLATADAALKFIQDLAEEELQYAKVGTGAEVALRHIARRARETREN